jgi:hypothetical protein
MRRAVVRLVHRQSSGAGDIANHARVIDIRLACLKGADNAARHELDQQRRLPFFDRPKSAAVVMLEDGQARLPHSGVGLVKLSTGLIKNSRGRGRE